MFGESRMKMPTNGSDRRIAADDDYFPSLLTAIPSAPKGDKAKDGTSSDAMTHLTRLHEADAWPSKNRPRMTFAESLSMVKKQPQDVEIENSPFSYGDGNYMDRMYVRKRKPRANSDDKYASANDIDEDVPPPPTSTLSDPSSYLYDHLPTSDGLDGNRRSDGATAFNSSYVNATYAAGLHGDAWGHNKQYWVTVFGFPASSKPYILHEFQKLGEVINFAEGTGNWLHIRYYTRLQAEKALSYDGKTLTGNIMVGVKKCYPSDLDGIPEAPASNLFVSHGRQNPGSRDLEVDPTDADIMLPPRRRQDICSRVLNYLFKW